jgi:hypothetical protein
MADTSAAGRELARRRWGHTRVDTLVHELATRAEQLTDADRVRLRALAELTESTESEA